MRSPALTDLLARHGIVPCGDNSCIFGSPGGMGTNGGCRTLKDKDDTRRALMTLVRQLRARAKGGGNGNV